METNVGVFGTRGERLSIGRHGEASHGTEVTHVGTDLILIDRMEEASAELLGIEARSGYNFGTFSSTEQDVALEGRHDGAVNGTTSVINLEDFERLSIDELGSTVLGRGEEHSPLLIEAHLVNGTTMKGLGLQNLLGLSIVNSDGSLVIAGENRLIQTTPRRLAHSRCALQRSLQLGLTIAIPTINRQKRDEGHEGIRRCEKAVCANSKANRLDGSPA